MANVELTGAQVRELQAIEGAITTIQDVIDRAERAGLDVADLKARLDQAQARRIGLLAHFTPGASNRRTR